ncbi:MAG: immunoglobulin domain-containing protein, partial [Opitutaceae bacterium]
TLDGPLGTATFGYMMGIAVLPNGNLVVSEFSHVRTVTPDGTVATLPVVSSQPYSYFGAVAVDAAGNINVLDVDFGDIITITPSGGVTRVKPHFEYANGIAVDHAGNFFVTGGQHQVVWKLSIDGSVSVIGGLLDAPGSSDGVGTDARFENPSGIALDAAGNVYVSCSAYNSNTIRKGVAVGTPAITTQPQSLTVARGATAQFSVVANGLPAPTYQWVFNGTPINGATSTTLTLSNVQTSDAGDYTVVVTNPAASLTSNKAKLTVSTAPVSPPPSSGSSGGSGGGAPSLWFVLALLLLGAVRGLSYLRVSSP